MPQLILESQNEQSLKLIQELAEKLDIHCRLILQKTTQQSDLQTKDPLLSLDGILSSEHKNIADNHDDYIGHSP